MSRSRSVQANGAPGHGGAARVLHLIDPLASWTGPCGLRLLGDFVAADHEGSDSGNAAPVHHQVLIIGRRQEQELAEHCGVRAIGSIWPRRGRVLNAAGALRRWLSLARGGSSAPDVIHAWSGGCGALAALAAPALPRVVTPRPAAVEVDSPHLTPRQAVRDRWLREEGVQGDEFVVGLLGEHVERFDARQAMHVGARTGLSSRRIRLVMSGRSIGRPDAQRFLALLGLDRSIIHDEHIAQPWQVLSGLDAVLLLAPTASRRGNGHRLENDLSILPMLWAWAAGVPVTAEASASPHGLLDHDCNGLVFPIDDLNAGCDRVARLHDDRGLARRLADAARAQAARRFSIDAFRARVLDAYRQAIGGGRAAYLDLEHAAIAAPSLNPPPSHASAYTIDSCAPSPARV